MGNSLSLKVHTVSGTLLSILPNIFSHDIAKTAILAAVGATVSFCMSVLLKWISGFAKKKS